jgi:DNA-binding response OmpR family regulator
LLLSPLLEDHEFLGEIFVQREWLLHGAETLDSAIVTLRNRRIPVVIAERDLTPGNWKDALGAIQQLRDPPLLVVTSHTADEYLWAEVLNLGGHDVLAKPFKTAELQWVLESAWRIWSQKNKRKADSASARGVSGHDAEFEY